MQLVVDPTGQVCCLYSETLDLTTLGKVHVRRASHVEPDERGHWLADLEPVGGPRLGPYRLRSQALDAERAWLERHWLAPSPDRS